uniref:Cytochrome c oxidase subunit 2 n=8 Tax=Aphididae TaxID=27482 RepID=T1RKP3_9HEMI|nr:cytochrome c oxidase subunit II [Pemphigus bursarius]AGJ84187.1 cytochrome c oxidase subunit II [Pemphigus tibetensis]AGJ84188.1 cytochrome c oxidase subunit II [Pemphigus dorocola]AGJ84190.1 cytochrome c oxidase subunit II [Pemphigus borealis]AGJ84191.1 cytochrome c oxidase subunit II [Pemphigus sp. 23562]AGJ84192.1 cytochrome c oxidase subunit II [Pemphigus sp. 23563]AGJ84193.1 cytochrome c oxidase subunit II [Pemphigus sp. 25483]AKM70042.1 cytochrome oxidase subunit II [Eucallipterus t
MSWLKLNFQNSNSPLMEQLIFFHDHTIFITLMIMSMITYMMIFIIMNNNINIKISENQFIEVIWTIIPPIILIFIALPSLHLLYLMDEIKSPILTIKIMGHQWFWSYEYSDFMNIEFESYMINNINKNNFRLIEVDNKTIMPYKFNIRLLVSSDDVIHSWTIPSLAIKMDAIPGRMNQINLFMNRPGLYFGQCSEICGINHSFMPIQIESIKLNKFIYWIKNF